jgi:hypothetical protein
MTDPIPKILYKYREDSAFTEAIVTGRTVWLATAATLNDPLECQTGEIPEEWKRRTIRRLEDAQIEGFVMSYIQSKGAGIPFYSLSPREAKLWWKRLKRLETRQKKIAAVRAFLKAHGRDISTPGQLFSTFEKQLSQVGIFSMSECPDSQLMWSHYADGHTGLAFGFECIPGSKLSNPNHTMRVTYNDTKPVFDGGFKNEVSFFLQPGGEMQSRQKISFDDPTLRAAISMKPIAWSYEKEWRYIEESSGSFPWPGPLATVIFGMRMQQDRREHYRRSFATHLSAPVRYYEMKAQPAAAGIVVEPCI